MDSFKSEKELSVESKTYKYFSLKEAQKNRHILLGIMSAAGWDFYKKEWWHYQLFNAKKYKLIKNNMLDQPIM